MEVLVITPVKDSLETTRKTIEAVSTSHGNFGYFVFNDFSNHETRAFLSETCNQLHFSLINLEDITTTPSPNYKIILQKARELAIKNNVPLLLIESDVIVQPSTIKEMLEISGYLIHPGLVGAVTIDKTGSFNFPYAYLRSDSRKWIKTRHSISFCCTLITLEFLRTYDFNQLPAKKDWFDIFISKQSRKNGFYNYLLPGTQVLHLPHSSRPWKQLKYTNPLKYYYHKFLHHRDRI